MKRINLLLVVATVFGALCAQANNWYDRGNAGFVLACDGKKPVVLDLHENETRQLGEIQFSSQSHTQSKALDIIARLESHDKARASQYKSWALAFFNEVQWVHDAALNQTPDLGMVIIPNNCQLEQVVFQRNPSILNSKRYMINQNLWNQLDSDNQAALIVHEIIYREFMNSVTQEPASERIRVFNLVLHTNLLAGLTLPEYISLIQELHLTSYTSQNLKFAIGYESSKKGWLNIPVTLNEAGHVIEGTLAAQQMFIRKHISYNCHSTDLPALGYVQLDDNGTLRRLNVHKDFDTKLCGLPSTLITDDEGLHRISGSRWTFDEQERPDYISDQLPQSGHSLKYKGTTYIVHSSILQETPYWSSYNFDSELNLIALDLGGHPCRDEKTQNVIFYRTVNDAPSLLLSLDTAGNIQSHLPACY